MLLQLIVGVIVAYGGIVGVMYLTQRSLMYVPDLARVSPSAAGLPQAEEVTLTTADNEQLIAWHVAPQPDGPVVSIFRGTAERCAIAYTASRSSCSTVWACLPYPTAGSAARLVRRARLDFCSMPRPRMRLPHPVEALAKRYGLTTGETRVLLAIVEIGGVPEVAQMLGISQATVKTHLQHVFGKTSTTRQAELVKLIAGYMSPVGG